MSSVVVGSSSHSTGPTTTLSSAASRGAALRVSSAPLIHSQVGGSPGGVTSNRTCRVSAAVGGGKQSAHLQGVASNSRHCAPHPQRQRVGSSDFFSSIEIACENKICSIIVIHGQKPPDPIRPYCPYQFYYPTLLHPSLYFLFFIFLYHIYVLIYFLFPLSPLSL